MRGTYSLGSGRIDVNFSFFLGGGGGCGINKGLFIWGDSAPRSDLLHFNMLF